MGHLTSTTSWGPGAQEISWNSGKVSSPEKDALARGGITKNQGNLALEDVTCTSANDPTFPADTLNSTEFQNLSAGVPLAISQYTIRKLGTTPNKRIPGGGWSLIWELLPGALTPPPAHSPLSPLVNFPASLPAKEAAAEQHGMKYTF